MLKNFWIIALLFFLMACESRDVEPDYQIGSVTKELAERFDVDPKFYKKQILVRGVLIVGSAQINDLALKESAYLTDRLLSMVSSEMQERFEKENMRCIIVGYNENTSDLPEFRRQFNSQEKKALYNWRHRGFFTRVKNKRAILFAEEDVLEYEGGMQIESIFIHEFAHAIDGVGMDKRMQQHLKNLYEESKVKGYWTNDARVAQRFRKVRGALKQSLLKALVKEYPDFGEAHFKEVFKRGRVLVNGMVAPVDAQVNEYDKVLVRFYGTKGTYASKNKAEYFAEGVQCWFNTNRIMDHDHNVINTREELKAYDPELAALCEDIFGDGTWRFTSPRFRAGTGHLKGFDPSQSPVMKPSSVIIKARDDFYNNYWKKYWEDLKKRVSQ